MGVISSGGGGGATTDASQLSTGTLPLARLAGITQAQLDAAAGITSAQIAALDAAKITSGTLPLARLAGITTSQLDAAAGIAAGQIASVNPSALTGSGAVPAAALGNFAAADHGLLAWAYDPVYQASNQSPSAGVLTLVKLKLPGAASVTNVVVATVTAGSGLTNSYLGLYNTAGTLIGGTADQSTVFAGAAGTKTAALSGGPYSCAAGSYYVAFLVGAATGMPSFPAIGTSSRVTMSANLGAAAYRFGTQGSSLTALPSSLTLSSTALAGSLLWCGLS